GRCLMLAPGRKAVAALRRKQVCKPEVKATACDGWTADGPCCGGYEQHDALRASALGADGHELSRRPTCACPARGARRVALGAVDVAASPANQAQAQAPPSPICL